MKAQRTYTIEDSRSWRQVSEARAERFFEALPESRDRQRARDAQKAQALLEVNCAPRLVGPVAARV